VVKKTARKPMMITSARKSSRGGCPNCGGKLKPKRRFVTVQGILQVADCKVCPNMGGFKTQAQAERYARQNYLQDIFDWREVCCTGYAIKRLLSEQ
jgi:hypothetical protein